MHAPPRVARRALVRRATSPTRSVLASLGWALMVGVGCGSWSPAEPSRTALVPDAGERIGAAACSDCHASFEGHFAGSDYHPDCESCHGPAQQHAHTALARDIRMPGNADCEACHQIGSRTLLHWSTSRHAQSGILCSDCHDPHNRELLHVRKPPEMGTVILPNASDTTRLCSTCHSEVVAELNLPSHHPVGEGMIDCIDCHGPHESARSTLGAKAERCTSCHQEIAGPWVYEHAPVSEDCGYCHVPHGAGADFLLDVPQPAACTSCHTIPITGAVHEPWAFTTGCTDCHSAVHGSYNDPILRR